MKLREFPGDPVVRTLLFHCKGVGAIPGQRTKIPCSAAKKKKEKKRKRKIDAA